MSLLNRLFEARNNPFLSNPVIDASLRLKLAELRALLAMAIAYLVSSTAIAQSAQAPLWIVAESEESLSVAVGERINDLTVSIDDVLITPEDAARVQWKIEPADAARLETSATTFFTESSNYQLASTSVTALREGTFYIIATGFYDAPENDSPAQARNSEPPVLEPNEVAFTVTVGNSDNITQTQSGNSAPLTNNQLQANYGMQSACAAVQAVTDSASLSTAQINLLDRCDTFQLLSDPRLALNRLAADELFSIGDSMIDTGASQLGNIQARINTVRSSKRTLFDIDSLKLNLWGENISTQVLSVAAKIASEKKGDSDSTTKFKDSAFGFFANGNLSIGEVNGDGLQHDADIHTQGLTLGVDYRINQNVVIGTGFGIVSNDTDFTGDNGELQTQGLSLSVFATWYEADMGHADVVLDIGNNAFDLTRRVNLPDQPDEFAHGSTNATLTTLAISAARTFNKGIWTFGPSIRMQLTTASVDSFQEQSSLGANSSGTTLNVQSHSLKSMRLALGFDVSHTFNTRRAVLTPVVRAEYEVESENDKGDIEATFVHDPSATPMRFTGTERDDSYFNVLFGTVATFARSTSAFVFFESKLQNDYVSQNWLKMGLRLHF